MLSQQGKTNQWYTTPYAFQRRVPSTMSQESTSRRITLCTTVQISVAWRKKERISQIVAQEKDLLLMPRCAYQQRDEWQVLVTLLMLCHCGDTRTIEQRQLSSHHRHVKD
ncbi:hypothetical protein RDI58_021725 [Solanum bulbocastanum]|uniref:Uncharacterized protein n=1 Tax=Solanum bulbocastanum TaxID=147425 RepID=A0AAN8T9A0_SOLBU